MMKKFLFSLLCFISFIIPTHALTIYSGLNNGTPINENRYNYVNGVTGEVQLAPLGSVINGTAAGIVFVYSDSNDITKIYTLEINFKDADLLQSFNPSQVKINGCLNGLCNSPQTIISSIKNNNNGQSNKLTIKYRPAVNSPYNQVLIGNTSNPSVITGISNFGISSINLTSENQNQDIINNAQQNTDSIINNQNQNSQDIIDNQNQNNQQLIDELNDNFNNTITCSNLINFRNFESISGGSTLIFNDNGLIINNTNGYGILQTIQLDPNTTYTFSLKSSWNLQKGFQWGVRYRNSSSQWSSLINSDRITFTTDNLGNYVLAYYIGSPNSNTGSVTLSEIMLNKGDVVQDYCEFGTIKKTNKIDETNDKLNDINDTLNDTTPPDLSSFDNIAGWLPPGPIDSLLTLPLTMLNSVNNGLSKTCSSLHVPIPFLDNQFLDIPCLSSIFSKINGVSSFWTWCGTIASVIILYNYLLGLYTWIDDTLSLRENTMPGYYEDKWGGGA